MKELFIRKFVLIAVSIFLIVLVYGCRSKISQKDSTHNISALKENQSGVMTEGSVTNHRSSLQFVKSRWYIKTTAYECKKRGGSYIEHKDILPQDMVDCSLLKSMALIGAVTAKQDKKSAKQVEQLEKKDKGSPYSRRLILGSSYDYLYRPATEKSNYGLYSYVLLPTTTTRTECFLKELFKTTSFVELSGITYGNLNIIYIPTRADELSSLIPYISDGSAPPVQLFSNQFYDYSLSERLLANICTLPSKVTYDVCKTDLSRGPYLFTFTRPASALIPVPPPYLFVDLSSVHEKAFGEFIAAYKEQVKRTDYSDLERVKNLRLRLLSIVLTAADWIGPIKGAIADVIHLTQNEDTDK
jgi:hypothetical protein